MLWNDYSFCVKVVFYQATFFIIILQPMPLPNLPTLVLYVGKFSKPVLMVQCIDEPRLGLTTAHFCGGAAYYKTQ